MTSQLTDAQRNEDQRTDSSTLADSHSLTEQHTQVRDRPAHTHTDRHPDTGTHTHTHTHTHGFTMRPIIRHPQKQEYPYVITKGKRGENKERKGAEET